MFKTSTRWILSKKKSLALPKDNSTGRLSTGDNRSSRVSFAHAYLDNGKILQELSLTFQPEIDLTEEEKKTKISYIFKDYSRNIKTSDEKKKKIQCIDIF